MIAALLELLSPRYDTVTVVRSRHGDIELTLRRDQADDLGRRLDVRSPLSMGLKDAGVHVSGGSEVNGVSNLHLSDLAGIRLVELLAAH
ncbi:hypothetical protein [Catenulispora subtropica]|uniref:Uncharacterized protein n=1 Tax=Catenulispora subtropica TaxID=450798 RepID=A0ABN2R9V2_9ACTN